MGQLLLTCLESSRAFSKGPCLTLPAVGPLPLLPISSCSCCPVNTATSDLSVRGLEILLPGVSFVSASSLKHLRGVNSPFEITEGCTLECPSTSVWLGWGFEDPLQGPHPGGAPSHHPFHPLRAVLAPGFPASYIVSPIMNDSDHLL